jgi:rRNA-processing protein FCF1
MPTKLLVDTNFLLIPVRFKVDIFEESENAVNDVVEFYVSSRVLDEIQILKDRSKGNFVRELKLAEKLSENCTVINDDSSTRVDQSLINLAMREDMMIGTADAELRQNARKAGVKVVYLRQKSHLVLDGKRPNL